MNIVKHKFLALIFILLSAPIALGQEMEDEQSGGYSFEILEIPGDACSQELRRTGKKEGFTRLPNGKEVFFAIGSADVMAPQGNTPVQRANYINSIQNAYSIAALKAKKKLAETWSKEIKTKTKNSFIEQLKSGTPPKALLGERKAKRDEFVKKQQSGEGGLSMFEKARLLINQKLDSMISDETREKLEKENLDAIEAEKLLAAEIDKITDQNTFDQTIETSAQAEIRGMKTWYSHKSGKGICVVAAYSENLSKQADALASKDYSILKGLKKGKPIAQQIPSHTSRDGISKLMGMYGANITRDDTGQVLIVSFAQAGASRSDATAIDMAFERAILKADAQIAQLNNEAIEVSNKVREVEMSTGFANSDVKDYYSESNQQARIEASSNLKISGVSDWGRWAATNPDTKGPMVGVIRYWTPSGADFANKSREASKSGSGSPGGSKSSWSEESGYSSGGGLGDDDDF